MAINNINGSPVPNGHDITSRERVKATTPDTSRSDPHSARAQGTDEVLITGDSLRLREIETTLTGESSIDQTRVETLRKAIDSGQYQVDAARLATKMLDFENKLFR